MGVCGADSFQVEAIGLVLTYPEVLANGNNLTTCFKTFAKTSELEAQR